MTTAEQKKIIQYLHEAHATERALTNVLQTQIAIAPRGSRLRKLRSTQWMLKILRLVSRTFPYRLLSRTKVGPATAWNPVASVR